MPANLTIGKVLILLGSIIVLVSLLLSYRGKSVRRQAVKDKSRNALLVRYIQIVMILLLGIITVYYLNR